MQTHKARADWKFWLEEVVYFAGQFLYTLGEYLAAFCYLILLVVNMCSSSLHNESVEDERRRLYEEQRRQRYLEEEEREQLEFEEKQRLYALRFGNWQERQLAAVTLEERAEADAVRNKRGQILEVRHENRVELRTTTRDLEHLKNESNNRRNQISHLYCEVDYFRRKERTACDDERKSLAGQIRDRENRIARLEQEDKLAQIDLQNAWI